MPNLPLDNPASPESGAVAAPAKARTGAAPAGRSFTRASDRTPLKFLRSLRGDGVLIAGGAETPVGYQIDVFDSRMGRTGSGTLDGALPADLADGDEARLRLEDGVLISVLLADADETGAAFHTRGALPDAAGA